MTGRSLGLTILCLLFFNVCSANRLSTALSDTIAPDYDHAVDLCLLHQFDEAEILLRRISQQSNHPNRRAATALLLNEVYLWRGKYREYVQFIDSTGGGIATATDSLARILARQPPGQINLPTNNFTVMFRQTHKGHITVAVLVNGKPRTFLVDTGAMLTALSNRLANELRLPLLHQLPITNSLDQTITSPIYSLDSLKFGTLLIKKLPVAAMSLPGFGVDGVLGWDILRNVRFVIDYQNQKFTIGRSVPDPALPKNLLGGSRPLMGFRSETGSYLTLFFDSGSNARVSFSPIGVSKIGVYRTGRKLRFQAGFGGRWRVSWQRVIKKTTVKIDGIPYVLTKSPINRTDETSCSVAIDGIVGSKQFRKGRLTVDFPNNFFEYVE